jgi:glycosyltransferase involved in cell wall biosynthesis
MLDVIAYQVPGYHESAEAWFSYRQSVRFACSLVDGVIAISDHVREAIVAERLAVDPERVFVVPTGTSHLRGDEAEVMPDELLHRGFTGEDFLLVLGTDHTHKNRDLAIRTLEVLNSRGHDLSLVIAGAHVPQGSSRIAEAFAWAPPLRVHTLPSVTSAGRNWLLRHAALVLYPTSAEGFGLVPDEAAAFGTPTVFVGGVRRRCGGVAGRTSRGESPGFSHSEAWRRPMQLGCGGAHDTIGVLVAARAASTCDQYNRDTTDGGV